MASSAAMSDGDFDLADIIFDCSDPNRLASFWAEVLGRDIAGSKGPYVWLNRPAGAIGIGFQRVKETKVEKNRVHVDLAVKDLASAKRRVERLGGARVQGYENGGFLVMADPEGNEFCLVPVAPFDFDESGRTHYLDDLGDI
jgi:predicted enzyme related to lactoylglutathione lyase